MKTLKYIGLFIASFMFAACAVDEMGSADAESLADNSPVVISISDKNLFPVDMMKTRAGLNSVLSTVDDLNIRIHLTDGTLQTVYCSKTGTLPSDVSYIEDASGKLHDLANFGKNANAQLHFDGILASKVDYVEVVANVGDQSGLADWSSLKDSKNPVFFVNNPANLETSKCMMYGKATKKASGNIHSDDKGTPCNYFDVVLKRSRAMLTIQLKDEGLKDGVEITPKQIQIFNAAKECTLTKLVDVVGRPGINKIPQTTSAIASPVYSVNWGMLSNAKNSQGKQLLGGHINEAGYDAQCVPVLLLENMQGDNNPSNTSHITKFPAGVTNVAEAKDPAKNNKATYIEIHADYKYRHANSVKIGGNIIYRFFLGENVTHNFDVEGNHYYKLTLGLRGFGGAKEDGKLDASGNLVANENDQSWRVDMETKDWGFEKGEFDFDSHFFTAFAKTVGTNWKFTKVQVNGKDDDGGASWLVLRTEPYLGDNEWANPTQIWNNSNIHLKITEQGLEFQVQPMLYGSESVDPAGYFLWDTYKNQPPYDIPSYFGQTVRNPAPYREMVIFVQETGVPPETARTQQITVRQWVPIGLQTASSHKFFLERFEESPAGQIGWPWLFTGKDISTYTGEQYTDAAGMKYFYTPANVQQVEINSLILSQQKAYPMSAADISMRKTNAAYQGAPTPYYALIDKEMLDAAMSYVHDSKWGPFEPIYIYDDYWTCNVPQANKMETTFWSGVNQMYSNTTARDDIKRVRSIYAPYYGTIQ